MAKEMQFDYGTYVSTTLYGAWTRVNTASNLGGLEYYNQLTRSWVDESAIASSIPIASHLTLMTKTSVPGCGDYYGNAPAGIDLGASYTIRYYDAVAPQLGQHMGIQTWTPVDQTSVTDAVTAALYKAVTSAGIGTGTGQADPASVVGLVTQAATILSNITE